MSALIQFDSKTVDRARNKVNNEIYLEGLRQSQLWGMDFDQLNTPNDWATFITYYASRAAYDGRDRKCTPQSFRDNMKKVAALAQSAMIMIDLMDRCAPRHYET